MNIPGFRRGTEEEPAAEPAQRAVIEIDEEQLARLSSVFAAPRWLRDLGFAAWLLVGAAALVAGLVVLIGATSVITMPVLAAFVVACVATPCVNWLQRHRVPRAAGAALTLLALLAIGVLVLLLVLGGIASQSDEIGQQAGSAADKIQSWLEDAGATSSGASTTTDSASTQTAQVIGTFLHGVANGILEITSLALGLSFFFLSLFFMLKDGPGLRSSVEDHMGVPKPVARTITGNVIKSLRGYFAGVTIVAAFNGVVVGLGALALGVPLAGTLAVVSFVTAYIPYIGAFIAGAFAVILTLGSQGTTDAIIMLVIVLLANGLLQNILQPIAFGATLELNPLVVLIVTISAGALFGMIGLVLAAPLTSAAMHIMRDLANAKAAVPPPRDEPSPEPVPG